MNGKNILKEKEKGKLKLEINRKEFIKSWQIAERFADTKNPNEALKGVLITALENNTALLEATDFKTSVKLKAEGVNVLEPGKAIIPNIVSEMLKKSMNDTLSIETDEKRGVFKSGNNKTRFALPDIGLFPSLPDSEDATEIAIVNDAVLCQLIFEGNAASSTPQEFPKYMGNSLLQTRDGVIKCVATDGRRLSLSTATPLEIFEYSDLVFPSQASLKIVKMLEPDQDVTILANDSTVWFSTEDVNFSIRRIDTVFPNYEKIIKPEFTTKLTANSDDLLHIIDRVDVIAKSNVAHLAVLNLSADSNLKIYAVAPEKGTASENLLANIEGTELKVGFNVGYLQDGLKAIGSGEVVIEFNGDEGQSKMTRLNNPDEFLYMLMPARLSQFENDFKEDE